MRERRPDPLFTVVTGALAMLFALVLFWGSLHVSERPAVLGRYSVAYAGLLLALGLVLAVLIAGLVAKAARLREWLVNAYVLAASSVVALGALELGLRVFDPWGVDMFDTMPYHMQGMVSDPQLGYVQPKSVRYRLGANLIVLNSHGLRGADVPYAKPAGEHRLLALGDSVAFGWGVTQGETFPEVLERDLAGNGGGRWRAINAGVNGYNTQQEVTYFELYGVRYDPDIVVITFVDNDVEGIVRPNVTTWRRYPTWPDNLPEALSRLKQLSYTFQLGRLLITAREVAQAKRAERAHPLSVTSHPGWPAVRASLIRLHRLCEEKGIRLLFALYSGTDERLLDAVRSLGIDAITLEAAWDAVPAGKRFVSRIDPHPSALVDRQMARLLEKDLRQRGWLGRP